jgi:hypothetical protein
MPRCLPTRRATLGALLGSAGTLLSAPLLTSFVSLTSSEAHAQAARPVPIPVNTLRGEITFGLPPEIVLNGKLGTRLSPASRIRGQSNTLVMSGTLGGQTHVVNYNVDGQTGLVNDVWLLTAAEAARLWPTTAEEAAKWVFDPVSQNWSKP